MSAYKRKRPDEIAEILGRYKQHRRSGVGVQESYERTAEECGATVSSVGSIVRRFIPTTDVASSYLQAQALRLAIRVVRKADAAQAIEVLSRKNIGVLAPKTEEASGGGGFFLSVQADSCGAVKIGVASGQQAQLPAAQPQEWDTQPVIDVTAEPEPYVPQPQGHVRELGALSPRQEAAIAANKERLRKIRGDAMRAGKRAAAECNDYSPTGEGEDGANV